jgi:pilus assembly protein CpaE
VLSMPFSGFDLLTRINQVRRDFETTSTVGASRVISVFAPKGGVGKTTLAFNLAVSLGQQGQRVVLIDGSLQFGDLRALLKVPVDAPSILDLPTDRVAEADLQDVLWRDPSGIDILLAPPRVEMAEMITARDLDKVLSLLRRVYGVIVIDMSSVLNDINLAFLDLSDTIVEIVTYDSTTIHNTVAVADAFRMIGYSASKVRYLVNRADSAGGIDPGDLERAIGRVPEHRVVSDGILVVQSNNEGVPFVLANPAAQISQDVGRVAAEILAVHGLGAPVAGRR